MIRVASIGYGDIAQRSRFPELKELGDRAELVAIAGRDSKRLQACAERFDIPDTYTDVDEMLARDDVDAVLVLTAPDSHAEMTIKAVRAGKHVLLEKPMVVDLEEARAIQRAVDEERGARPRVIYPLPHTPSAYYEMLRTVIDSGAVGDVSGVECHAAHRGPTHAGWFYQRDRAGGGVLFDLGIYPLSAVTSLFGPAERVSALVGRGFEERTLDDGSSVQPDVEDYALVNLWMKRGLAVTVNANWNGFATHHHTRHRIAVFGREGMLHVAGPQAIYLYRNDETYDSWPVSEEKIVYDGYPCRQVQPAADTQAARGTMDEFLHRIETGDTSTTLLAQRVHIHEIMFAAYDSGDVNSARALKTSF